MRRLKTIILRTLLSIVGAGLALLFLLGNNWFVGSQLLPRLAERNNLAVSYSDFDISLWSGFSARSVRLSGKDFSFEASRLSCSYDLFDLLGKYHARGGFDPASISLALDDGQASFSWGENQGLRFQKLRLSSAASETNQNTSVQLESVFDLDLSQTDNLRNVALRAEGQLAFGAGFEPSSQGLSLGALIGSGSIAGIALENDSLSLLFRGGLDRGFEKLNWKESKLDWSRSSQPLVSFLSTASLQFSNSKGDLVFTSLALSDGALRIAGKSSLPALQKLQLADSALHLTYAKRDLNLEGEMQIAEWKLAQSSAAAARWKGSRVAFALSKKDSEYAWKDVKLLLRDATSSADAALDLLSSGQFSMSGERPQYSAGVVVDRVLVQPILELIGDTSTQQGTPKEQSRPSMAQNEAAHASAIEIPADGTLTLQVRRAVYRDYDVENFDCRATTGMNEAVLEPCRWIVNRAPVTLTAQLQRERGSWDYRVNTQLGELSIESLSTSIRPESTGADSSNELSGRLKSLELKIHGPVAGTTAATKRALRGNLDAEFADMQLPTTLQSTPPFNIIFLPIVAVQEVGSVVGAALLPASLTEMGSSISETLRRQGKIGIRNAQIHLSVNDRGIEISKTYFKNELVPDFDLEGEVEWDKSLSLSSGIGLLGRRLPLPITGSLGTPVPNIPKMALELVQSVGRSAIGNTSDVVEALSLGSITLVDDEQQPNTPQLLSAERVQSN